jgi:hypothetical protein
VVKRLILLLALALPVAANDAMVDLVEVWSTLKYQHPWTLQRELDLDGMLVRAIPKVRAAKTDAEAAKAIGEMLAELGDPGTRVAGTAKPGGQRPPLFRREGDTLIVTAGANGDVTNFPLPGGFTVGFTGHDVRHADDRQLQRIGLVPDIRVEPTVKGIREGKDEVLARAVAYVNTGK